MEEEVEEVEEVEDEPYQPHAVPGPPAVVRGRAREGRHCCLRRLGRVALLDSFCFFLDFYFNFCLLLCLALLGFACALLWFCLALLALFALCCGFACFAVSDLALETGQLLLGGCYRGRQAVGQWQRVKAQGSH